MAAAINATEFVARLKSHLSPAESRRKELYDLYLRRHDRINNWDLVDRSAISGEVDNTFRVAEILVNDKQDLINKAVGGWVREAGKQDRQKLLSFLDTHAATMPRVALRYAIEHLSRKQRDYYLGLKQAGA